MVAGMLLQQIFVEGSPHTQPSVMEMIKGGHLMWIKIELINLKLNSL